MAFDLDVSDVKGRVVTFILYEKKYRPALQIQKDLNSRFSLNTVQVVHFSNQQLLPALNSVKTLKASLSIDQSEC